MTNPISHDTERAVLGAFTYNSAFAARECRDVGLDAGDFADERHGTLYQMFLGVVDRGEPVDSMTIRRVLDAAGLKAGSLDDLCAVADEAAGSVATAANVRYHAKGVKSDARRRRTGSDAAPELVQDAQVGEALAHVERPGSDFLRLPWPALDAVIGGITPGSQVYVTAYTGSGKTSFMLSVMCRMIAAGRRVFYAGLESRPKILRTQLACRVLGYDPGRILSGDYRTDADAEMVREAVKAELERQRDDERYRRVRFSPQKALSPAVMSELLHEARDFAPDMVVIDHIDHGATPVNGNHYADSRATVNMAHDLTHRFGLRTLIATQTNVTGFATDPFRNYRPVRPEQIFMGSHKLQVADVALGLYRPLRADATKEQVAAVRDSNAEVATVLAQNTIAVNVMKHRLYGERTGKIIRLGFWRGEVIDAPPFR